MRLPPLAFGAVAAVSGLCLALVYAAVGAATADFQTQLPMSFVAAIAVTVLCAGIYYLVISLSRPRSKSTE